MNNHFTIKFTPIINGKFQQEMITGTPATDIKPILGSVISKLIDRFKDEYSTIRVEIVSIVTKSVSEKEYNNLASSFVKFE